MLFHRLVAELAGGEETEGFKSEVAQVCLFVLQKLPELIAGTHQQLSVAVHVDDEIDCFEEDRVLCVGVLHLLRLWRLLHLLQDGLEAVGQAGTHCSILYNTKSTNAHKFLKQCL